MSIQTAFAKRVCGHSFNLKIAYVSLKSHFLFFYLSRISEKGVPCANAMAEIIPNEPDAGHAAVGIFLSVSCLNFS